MYILNRNEEIVAILSGNADDSGCHFFNSTLTLEINKGASLVFEVDTSEYDIVQHIKEENMVVVNDGETFRLLIIKEVSDVHDSDYIKEVYCEDASIELIDEVITEEVSGKVEMGIVLADLLEGTRWSIGEVDNTYIRNVKPEFKLKSVLNGIQALAKQYDAEIDFTVEFAGNRIVKRKVNMKKSFGRALGKRFEFGKDVTSIKRTVNTSDIKTAIIPFGKPNEETGEALTIQGISWATPTNPMNKPLGQIYLEDAEATALWGYKGVDSNKRPRWVAVTFEECEDANELLSLAHLQLNRFNKPKISYEANVIDLFRMMGDDSYSFEKVGLGDLVNIIDHNFVPALALSSRVVKLELDLNDTSNSVVTLGTIVESIVDKDIKTQIEELNMKVSAVASNVDLSDIEDRLDTLESETGTGRWEQIQEVNNLLFGNSVGYHYMSEDSGIWVFDKPANQNPTKAVALKGGMIGLAKYDSQKQVWNVGTFIDGNSVNASMINTGTLKADRIEAGALTVNHFNQELKSIIKSVGDKPSREEVTTSIQTAVDNITLSVKSTYTTKSETESAKTSAITESKKYSDTKKAEAITQAGKDADSKVNSAKTELTNKIDALQVGGRNLVKNSMIISHSGSLDKSDYISSGTLISTVNGVNQGFRFDSKSIYEANQQYVLSFCIQKQSGTIDQLGMTHNGKNHKNIKVVCDGISKGDFSQANTSVGAIMNDGNVHKIEIYFTTSSDIPTDSGVSYTYIQLNKATGTPCSAKITKFKLEKGTKATDWSPAPEDISSAIDKKANSTDVYKKSETYTKSETDSKIKVAKDEINLGVSNKYETKTNVETKVNNAVNNIKIGGRNLISPAKVQAYSQYNTVKPNTINGWTITKKETSNCVAIKQSDFTPEVGKTYTFSGYATVNGQPVSEGFFASNRLNTYLQPADRIVVNNGYFEVVQNWNTSSVWILHCAFMGVTNGAVVDFSNLMLEEGNKASAYTKNPNDIDEAINKKANTIDVYNKSETYSKAQTDSAIKVAKDEINLGVKNTYETKSNVESKITTAVNNVQVGGTNIIKGTNTISQIGSSGTWSAGTWRSASGGTGIREIVAVSSSPNPNIKKGIKITTTSNTTGNTDIAQDNVPVVNGATYTLSCYARKISGDAELKLQYGKSPYPNISTKITSTSWTKFSYTFTVGKKSDGSTDGSTNIYFGLKGGFVGSVEMCGFKLEYGNKATDWTPAPEDVDSALSSKANSSDVYKKTEVYTRAETNSQISVAKDSITNTVSQNYVTKSDATNTYATKSSLTQTANSITAKFTESGGYNLLRNSSGYNGTVNWTPSGLSTYGTFTTTATVPTGRGIYIDNGTKTSESFMYSSRFRLAPNTKYTLTGWFNNYTACPNFDVFVLSSNSLDETSDNVASYDNAHLLINKGDTNGYWKEFTATFTTPASTKSGVLRIDNNGYDSAYTTENRVYFSSLVLVEGSVSVPWSPHPNEVYDGNTTIDKNGITVKNGGLTIKNNSGTTVFSGDTSGNLKLAGSITSGATITGGTLKSSNNDMYFDLNGGYMLLYNNGIKIGQTNKNNITGTSIYGVSNGAEYGKYSTLSAKTSPSDATYSMMMTVSGSDLTSYISKGVNLGANFHTNNWNFKMGKSSELCWRQSGSNHDSFITEGSEGMLRLYGDNGMYLGYRVGDSNTYVIAIKENGSHVYPKALSLFNSEGDIPSNGEYSVEITAPLKMRGQAIDECSNIKTLGLEIVEPLAFYSDDSEETTTTYTVTKNSQNVVEFLGSTEIVNGEVTVPLPNNMVFRNYVVLLTPIGLNRNVSLVEKADDSFKLMGDDGTVDYVIKFESVDYSKYMSKSISINTVDNIQRSEDDLPKVIELSEDSSPFIDVPTSLEDV